MRAGGELVAGCANAVTGGEQTLDGGHRAVAPAPALRQVVGYARQAFVGRSTKVGRAGHPDTAAAGVRTEQVGLGRHQLGHLLLGLDVLANPDAALTDAHVEEVFPGFGFKVLHFLGGQSLA